MDHATLLAEVESLKVPYLAERDALQAKMQAIISGVMSEMKIDNISSLKMHGLESAEVVVPCHSCHNRTIDISFRIPWESKDEKRRVELNTCTFGSFDCNDQSAIDYYLVAGALASSLKTLQKRFDALDESAYKAAYRAYNKARYELEKMERERKEQEYFQNIKEIESKLVVGTKLRIGYNWKKEPIYDTIAHVTSKNILLEKDYGTRTKKTVAVDRILHKKWEFV